MPLRKSFLLILIASAFLLSVKSASATARHVLPTSRNKQLSQSNTQSSYTPETTPSPTFTQAPTPTAIGAPKTQPPKTKSTNAYDWFFPPIWSNWALVIAAIVAACVALKTLDAIRRSNITAIRVARATRIAAVATERYVEMTAQMVEAAKQSARAAEMALNAEKPYLFVEPLRIDERTDTVPDYISVLFPEPHKRISKTVTSRWLSLRIRNRGKGVAIIESIHIRPCVVSREPKYGKSQTLSITDRVIGSGETSQNGCSIPERAAPPLIDTYTNRFAVVGYVRYRDVYDRHYRSTFGYYYRPSNILLPDAAYFFLAAEKHNRIHEEEQNTGLSQPD